MRRKEANRKGLKDNRHEGAEALRDSTITKKKSDKFNDQFGKILLSKQKEHVLFSSLKEGDVAGFHRALQNGANPDITNKSGLTPLIVVLSGKLTSTTRKLCTQLLAKKADPNIPAPNGDTALHLAAGLGDKWIVKMLLSAGADVNATRKDSGKTPLDIALDKGHQEVVEVLMSKSRTKSTQNAAQKSQKRVDASPKNSKYSGSTDLNFEKLTSSGSGKHTLENSCNMLRLGKSHLERYLKSKRLNVNTFYSGQHCKGMTILHATVGQIDPTPVKILIELAAKPLLQERDNGQNALHLAIRAKQDGHLNLMITELKRRALLQEGLSSKDYHGNTLLHFAAEAGHKASVKLLLKYRVDPYAINKAGDTSIYIARKNGHDDIAELLINYAKKSLDEIFVDLNAAELLSSKSKNKSNKLHLAANNCDEELLADMLAALEDQDRLNEGLDSQDVNGDTPLHLAIKAKSVKCAMLLLRYGADTTLLNRKEDSPIQVALNMGFVKLADRLMKYSRKDLGVRREKKSHVHDELEDTMKELAVVTKEMNDMMIAHAKEIFDWHADPANAIAVLNELTQSTVKSIEQTLSELRNAARNERDPDLKQALLDCVDAVVKNLENTQKEAKDQLVGIKPLDPQKLEMINRSRKEAGYREVRKPIAKNTMALDLKQLQIANESLNLLKNSQATARKALDIAKSSVAVKGKKYTTISNGEYSTEKLRKQKKERRKAKAKAFVDSVSKKNLQEGSKKVAGKLLSFVKSPRESRGKRIIKGRRNNSKGIEKKIYSSKPRSSKTVELLKAYEKVKNLPQTDEVSDKNPCHIATLLLIDAITRCDMNDIVLSLEKEPNVNWRDENGDTPLILALRDQTKSDMACVLLNSGADPTVTSGVGHAPLHFAASSGLNNVIELLLRNEKVKVDIRTKDQEFQGATALHLAVMSGHHSTVVLLVKKGADYSIRMQNSSKSTALDLANAKGHKEIISFLELKQVMGGKSKHFVSSTHDGSFEKHEKEELNF